MKILFDQGTPVPLRRSLPGHQVHTAYERGWSELGNGDLLAAAERDGYELLLTSSEPALSTEPGRPLHRYHGALVHVMAAHPAAYPVDPKDA